MDALVRGAEVSDPDAGVAYRVTIRRSAEGPVLRTLKIEPRNGQPIDPATLRRVPVATLAQYVHEFLILLEETNGAGELLMFVGPGGVLLPQEKTSLNAETVAELLRQGHTRHTIAAKGYALSTADEWIRKARAEYADDPSVPKAKRGPRPKTSRSKEGRQ